MPVKSRNQYLKKLKRVVIKIGSSILAGPEGGLNRSAFRTLARGFVDLTQTRKLQLVLVSSGAIACGMQKLGFKKRPTSIAALQACAATGQSSLMHAYERAFAVHKLTTAQILITRDDLNHRRRYLNAKHTLHELLSRKIIPVVNENDTVVVEEIKVGDNDTLAAHIATLIEADLLLLLTDRDGLFTADPKHHGDAKRISLIKDIDHKTTEMAGAAGNDSRIGGMQTKLAAARSAGRFGIPTIIADGSKAKTLEQIFAGVDCGTLFLPSAEGLNARKHWIAYTLSPQGQLQLDAGAIKAIREAGKSLLATGIVRVHGDFEIGDAVDLVDAKGTIFARGLVAYNAKELQRIKGCKSSEIEKILGYRYTDEVIHRDDLATID